MTTYDFLYWFWLYNPPYFTISNSIIFIVQCISIHATNLHGTNFFIRFNDTACNVTSDEKNFLLFFLCCCLSNNIDLKVTFLLPEGKWTIHQYSWVISPFRLSWTIISTATNLPTMFIIVLLPHIDWLVSKDSSTRSTIWFLFDSLTMFLSMSYIFFTINVLRRHNILPGSDYVLLNLCSTNIILSTAHNTQKVLIII